MMTVGIDPGLRHVGMCLVRVGVGRVDVSEITTFSTTDPKPMPRIASALREFIICGKSAAEIEREGFRVAIEEQSLVQQGKQQRGETNFRASMVRDVSMLAYGIALSVTRGEHPRLIGPRSARKRAYGTSRATEGMMRRMLEARGVDGAHELDGHQLAAITVAIAAAGA